jgi:hypothetical protein
MYFFRNFNKVLFRDTPEGKAKEIGETWLQKLEKKASGAVSLSIDDLLKVKAFNEFDKNEQIYLSNASLYHEILGEKKIKAPSTTFFKETEKKEDQEKFGDLKKFSFSYSEKDGFVADFEFGPEYDGSLKSSNTKKLYDFLDRMQKDGKLQYRKDFNSGKLIIRISVRDIYEKSLDLTLKEKKFVSEIEEMSDFLLGDVGGVGGKFLIELKEAIESGGKKDDPKTQEAIKDAQNYAKFSCLKIAIENGHLDKEIKHRLTEKIAENMKKEFEEIGSNISQASGANFKEVMTEKLNDLGGSKNPFYQMASLKVSESDVLKCREEYLKNIEEKISKNPYKNKIEKEDLKKLFEEIKNEKSDLLKHNVQKIEDQFGKETVSKAIDFKKERSDSPRQR